MILMRNFARDMGNVGVVASKAFNGVEWNTFVPDW